MKYSIKNLLLIFTLFLCSTTLFAQSKTERPKVNQIGYYPESTKIAILPSTDASVFYLRDTSSGSIIYEGSISDGGFYSPGGESVDRADFSNFLIPGTYVLGTYEGVESYEFIIDNNPFSELSDAILKAFYYNRASIALPEEYAGVWARALGHPDTNVKIHNSAASENRPANSSISSPKGWYDAGDFNKYVVPISSSISQLLFAYEEFPEFFQNQNLNIPESTNSIPDVLDESLWALRWLFTMQDPDDGGVYHKLTTENFQATVMPSFPTAPRYVVQKGTGATYDFAAVMAQAARIYASFLPDFADSALAAAEKAWAWGNTNPNISYNQNALSDPAINTGAYGDGSFTDEAFWAASELYITTKDEAYYLDNGWNSAGVVGWNSVRGLGLFSMVANRTELTSVAFNDTTSMKNRVLNIADSYINSGNSSPYRSPFGTSSNHFFWGSNGFAGNIGLASMLAYRVSGNEKYYKASIDVLDFIMGRNPLDQSYITGFGDNPPMNIHHRQSAADGIINPVPGWVAGGANPGNQNQDCGAGAYNSTLPALSFLDRYCSYSTNEITTYWNSPFVYLTAGLEYLTPLFSTENTKTGFFKTPDFNELFSPGDSISLTWDLENYETYDLYYRDLSESTFQLLAQGLTSNDSVFTNFVIPNSPGARLVFRIEETSDQSTWFQSPILHVTPSKSISILDVRTSSEFEPNKRVTIEWNTIQVDTVDLFYRLSSETHFSLLAEKRPASRGNYSAFRVPDAPGDSLIIRITDSSVDTVFAESEPILIVTPVFIEENRSDLTFYLNQNYPNPFNPTTSINYSIAENGFVTLTVYNLQGQMVAELVNETKTRGEYSVTWNASNVASGVYYYRLQSNNDVRTQKMMLIK